MEVPPMFVISGKSVAIATADKIEFVRDYVGPDVHILIDGHMGNSSAGVWPFETAKAIVLFEASDFEPDMRHMADAIVECAELVHRAVAMLPGAGASSR